jgi:DNA-binding response OmpR family regulator
MKTVLLVEDDENLGQGLAMLLKRENYLVLHAKSLAEAYRLSGEPHDIVVLDWMLPDGQGIDYLRHAKSIALRPVIMLTARADVTDKVLGLELGADDYLTKPFEPRELAARIRVQLRREPAAAAPNAIPAASAEIRQGEIVIQIFERKVSYRNADVPLTKMEFDLLKLLVENPGKVFSRDELLNKVWGFENYPTTRTVDTHVLQLRQKFDDSLFETVRGIGYRFKISAHKP